LHGFDLRPARAAAKAQSGEVLAYIEAHSVENRIPISAALESCGKEEVSSGDSLANDNVGFEKSQAHGCFSWHSF
jgi:hypothetical protein